MANHERFRKYALWLATGDVAAECVRETIRLVDQKLQVMTLRLSEILKVYNRTSGLKLLRPRMKIRNCSKLGRMTPVLGFKLLTLKSNACVKGLYKRRCEIRFG